MTTYNPSPVTRHPSPVVTGLDALLADPPAHLRGLSKGRVGLLTNPTGVTRDLRPNFLALREAGVNLVALFSPEHGLAASAAAGETILSGREPQTGLPIYSLYGHTRKPTPEMLAQIDILLFDLQDVGVRFYTYTATLGLALEACAESGVPLVVLDRPNPITGLIVEGPVLDPALQSFVGYGPISLRYGMTLGELARFYHQTLSTGADLQVVPLRGWRRGLWGDQTGLPWVPPSPAMPHVSTSTVYPGTCLLEGTNLSVGRGTALPFELVGAPYVDGHALAAALNDLRLEGVRFRAAAFVPASDKHAGQNCAGVQIHVTDRATLRPLTMSLHLISVLRQLFAADFRWRAEHFDRLIGDAGARAMLEQQRGVGEIVARWADGAESFSEARRAALLYG
ncbi:MAG: DUF1343 domain-containing protein [Chloroflexi bacterium]|nr:DUF1343 domain-containing protein [Chloroflexota bacterium]MBI3732870.1 DUF1343 domain-containing protein [Chloroflexota bacterium]